MLTEDIEARAIFLHTLAWLMAITARYHSLVDFGLIHIDYGDRNELGEAFGAQEAVHQLADVTQHLKKAFRKTDLVGRNGCDFWVIVPYTASTERLFDKVMEILQSSEHEGLRVVNPEISIFDLTAHMTEAGKQSPEFGPLDLLAHLKASRKTLAQHVFCLHPVPNGA